jgi:PAS domain S-box-containing protein
VGAREKVLDVDRVLDECPVGLLVVNSDGWIELANIEVERMFGYERHALQGRASVDLVAGAARRRFDAQRRHYFGRPQRRSLGAGVEFEAVRRDGAEFVVQVGFSPLEDARVLLAVSDISERKNSEQQVDKRLEELARSNNELEQFAYVASHDMREPLRMITSYIDLLVEEFDGKLDARTEQFMGYVSEGGKRMQRLIDDLLAYCRLDATAQPVVPTDAAEAMRHAISDLHPLIEETGAEITQGRLPTLLVDPVQLDQLFQNVLHNAIKFHREEPPRVHVGAQDVGAMWRFAVQDNGIGIDKPQCARIFQMFQRLHDRSSYDGSGIGLAVAKKIVLRHGGEIWVESRPGSGSTFYFTLPGVTGGALVL